MPAWGAEAAREGVKKYLEIRKDIILFLKENNGVYEGTLDEFCRKNEYYKKNCPIPTFIKFIYVMISEGYLNCEDPTNPSRKRTIKLTLTDKGR